MAIRLLINNDPTPFVNATWSGSHNQSSRSLTFTVPNNPYDENFENQDIRLGSVVTLYDDDTLLFTGTTTSREKTAEVGTASYTAQDYMHHLLRSNASYKFKNTTPEKITKRVCSDVGIKTQDLASTDTNIKKLYFEDQCLYDIIIKAYRKARKNTKKNYMPAMIGSKVTVIEKGTPSGVVLDQTSNVTGATYTDTTDNIVNTINVYNDKSTKVSCYEDRNTIASYGVYMATYTMEDGVDYTSEAKSMVVGVTKEASIEAVGDLKAISGYSIEIHDESVGLTGTFYITEDSHVFENGVHTMSLSLAWDDSMEEGASTA